MMHGTLLGKRYRILERVGGGGMALVYRAEDIYLGRPVAVKVLRSQFGADEEFVRRFRREAQSAASLSHPNIVAIYDVGEEEDLYYIVMELVEGRTLKSRIQEEGPLPVDEAARIAIEILDALEHAHQHHIVHRDIKPHNILLTKSGRVKVTDFGIARAVTTDTVTNTGSIMGSAHYFSPEMARGQPAGVKSDLYSLGVVLYEMLTGRVPFQGESPISVALKHVQEEVLPPAALNGDLPAELQDVVLRALEKDPADRYESALAMRRDLERFLADYRAGRTRVAAAVEFPTQDLRQVRSRAQKGAAGRVRGGEEAPRRSRAGLWITLLLALLLLGAAGGGAFYVMRLLEVPEVQVPPLVGLSAREAESRLSAAGLKIKFKEDEYSDQIPINHVTWQSYEPGYRVKYGREIEVRLSKGPRQVTVPAVTGKALAEARDEIERAGLKPGAVLSKYVAGVPEGRVAEQSLPAGQTVREGTVVDLTVSKGALLVPPLVGRPLPEVTRILKDVGLELGTVDRVPNPRPKDTVVEQYPPPGTDAAPGSKVNLKVSQGADLPVQESTKTIEVRTNLTGYVKVTVFLQDATGQYSVHDQPHLAGEKFPLNVLWRGTAGKLTVLINGAFAYEIPLP